MISVWTGSLFIPDFNKRGRSDPSIIRWKVWDSRSNKLLSCPLGLRWSLIYNSQKNFNSDIYQKNQKHNHARPVKVWISHKFLFNLAFHYSPRPSLAYSLAAKQMKNHSRCHTRSVAATKEKSPPWSHWSNPKRRAVKNFRGETLRFGHRSQILNLMTEVVLLPASQSLQTETSERSAVAPSPAPHGTRTVWAPRCRLLRLLLGTACPPVLLTNQLRHRGIFIGHKYFTG